MLLTAPLEDVNDFVKEICNFEKDGKNKSISWLSKTQIKFIAFAMSSMLILGCFCWKKMERFSLGLFAAKALAWMLHHSLIPWSKLWEKSVLRIIKISGLKGRLVIDDTDRIRAKNTSKLYAVNKVKDKKTGGFSIAQNIVFIVFVTDLLTIPVGFRFFSPDPIWKAWREKDIKLRKLKVKKSERPKKPERDPNYPTRISLAISLVEEFKKLVPEIVISDISADSAYLTKDFIKGVEKSFPAIQIVSQIRSNYLLSSGKIKLGKAKSVKKFFEPTFRIAV